MKLKDLIECNLDIEITSLATNTKDVKKGSLFICISGVKADRHNFIPEAIAKGASALIVSKKGDYSIPYVLVSDVDKIAHTLYQKFYDYPHLKLKLIGITGTDGKTSTTTIIQSLLGKDKCAYIGTNGISYLDINIDSDNTTPGYEVLYEVFDKFYQAGIEYVAMETSSESFYRKRLEGLEFIIGGYTNITSEHLNVHKTLENYISCKKELFKHSQLSIFNSDDLHFNELKDGIKNYQSYGKKGQDLIVKSYQVHPNKTDITLSYQNKDYHFTSPLLGDFNVENIALAYLVCLNLGLNMEELIEKTKDISIDGRMVVVDKGQDFYCIVDYAHTPNGVNCFLKFAKTLDINRIIVVIGQAGERDTGKRSIVGKIVADNADYAIFTEEDPRNEDVLNTINDIIKDIKDYENFEIVPVRKDAIERAINIASTNDLVAVLGKGNDDFSIIKGEYKHSNDIEMIEEAISLKLS